MPQTDWIWPAFVGLIIALSGSIPYFRTRRGRTVFVSYRRSDSAVQAALVRDQVARRFGRRRVFFDVHSLEPGDHFRREIDDRLRQCDAALVIIGPTWASCTDAGELRLHQPRDVVRAEVEAALRFCPCVVPVLTGQAEPPTEASLPTELRALAHLQVVRFDEQSAAASLSSTLDAIARAPVRRTPLLLLSSHAAVVVFPLMFYQADGLRLEELMTVLGIVMPTGMATAAAALAFHVRGGVPARVRRVPPRELFLPLLFVALIGGMVLAKAFNIGISDPEIFKYWLLGVELAFSAYTGLALSSLFDDRVDDRRDV
jgi:hypothetical protein